MSLKEKLRHKPKNDRVVNEKKRMKNLLRDRDAKQEIKEYEKDDLND